MDIPRPPAKQWCRLVGHRLRRSWSSSGGAPFVTGRLRLRGHRSGISMEPLYHTGDLVVTLLLPARTTSARSLLITVT